MEAPGAADVEGAGLCVVTGFLATGLFFSTNALAAGFRLRTGAGAPAFGVVELGPEGGVGMELLFMARVWTRDQERVLGLLCYTAWTSLRSLYGW